MRKLNNLSQMRTGLISKQLGFFNSHLNAENPFSGDRSDAGRLFHRIELATLRLLSPRLLCGRGIYWLMNVAGGNRFR